MDRAQLRDVKASFVRDFMSRGSGIYGVKAYLRGDEPHLLVTVAEGRRSPVGEYHGVKVEVRSGSPGAVAVASRFG